MSNYSQEIAWYEVWVSASAYKDRVLHFLLLWRDNGTFGVYDPLEMKYSFVSDNYEDAVNYLREDDFEIVNSRMDSNGLAVPCIPKAS